MRFVCSILSHINGRGYNAQASQHDIMRNGRRKRGGCQDRFSSTILLGGPGLQGTNEEVSPDTSRC